MSALAHTTQPTHLEPDSIESYRLDTEYDGNCLHYTEYPPGGAADNWTVGEVLGRGIYSVIRKHLHEKTGRVRAVKTIEKSAYPFHAREFNIMAILNEPEHRSRFVEFLGWFENHDRLFIAMEYFEQGDLRKHLDKQLGGEVVQIITRQVLNGLQTMHANNIAHRDLKPDNIFVVSMSPVWVKLGDFGISKRIHSDTSFRSRVYTDSYAAPEVLGIDPNSESSIYTNAVDMWSLGCVVYELLAGEKLFSSLGHIMKFFYTSGTFPEQKLRKLAKLATPSFDAVKSFIQGLVLLDPDKRPSAVDAANDIWLQELGIVGQRGTTIKRTEAALAATLRGHPDRAGIYSNLGKVSFVRFERIGDLGDLQKAIKYIEAALAATPGDHPDRAGRYSNLGAMLSARCERIGDPDDLQKAIKYIEAALAATPRDHPDRAGIYSNLGNVSFVRFKRMGGLDDLQKAIEHIEAALAATPRDHPDRAGRYSNLGAMFSARFKRIGDLDDLQKAIKHIEKAVAATPQDHPDRAHKYNILGTCFQSRYFWTHSAEDFNECLRLYHEAWHCRISPPKDRIKAARGAGHLLHLAGRFHESSSILEDAIHLMPSVNLQLLKRDDQQHILSELSGLASTAASVALQAGRGAYHSLKLLEISRGIITGFAIDSRSEVSDLKVDYRFEFDQYHRLRAEINSPIDETMCGSDGTQNQDQTSAVSRRWDAFKEMEAVLTHIRSLPGYGGFLLPPSEEALKEIAKAGPIVVFNSTPYRSDAIIVTATAITSLGLPKLDYKKTGDWMTKLASFGGSGLKRRQDNQDMKDLLMWLWDAAVGPVFDRLESSGAILSGGADETNLKRIWWIGVGQLSMAPFHAAGDHSRGSTRNTLSRAISTYIPTIKALSYARQKELHLFDECGASLSPERSRNARLLIVPMPETPGAANLPGVHKEVQYIFDSTTNSATQITVLSNPTPAEVLKQFQHYDIVHFACHGASATNPSDSHLVLLTPDGSDSDKLLARDISSLNTPGAQLAYLSTCSSAKNPSTTLADEVIHLASAFQLAGFSHTFATLWETEDQASSEVARDFYDLLFQHQRSTDDNYRVSAAFHKAVKKVRDKRAANYLGWASFVHTGA